MTPHGAHTNPVGGGSCTPHSLSGTQAVGGTVLLLTDIKMRLSLLPRREREFWRILPQHEMFCIRRDIRHSTHSPLSELVTRCWQQKRSEKCHLPTCQKMSQSGYEGTPKVSPTTHIAWWCLTSQHHSLPSREQQHVDGKMDDALSHLHLDQMTCCNARWGKELETVELRREQMH